MLPYSRNLKKIVTDGLKLSYMIVKIISVQDLCRDTCTPRCITERPKKTSWPL